METPDVPSRPLTVAEHKGNKLLQDGAYEIQLGGVRRILTSDDLHEMTDLRPRFEKELRLPLDSRGATTRVYMFSVDGTLRGEFLKGCLFAGECMLVQADSFEKALRLAKDGLHSTREALQEEYSQRRMVQTLDELANSPVQDGLAVDAAGKNGRPANDEAPLHSDPKLKAMLATIFGGKKRDW